jgi:hypothetical protein
MATETTKLIQEIREAGLLTRAGADDLSEKYGDMDPARIIAKLYMQVKCARHQAGHYRDLFNLRSEQLETARTGVDPMDLFNGEGE